MSVGEKDRFRTAERVEVGNHYGLAWVEAGQDLDGAQAARAGLDAAALGDVGFTVAPCQGTYFLLADFTGIWDGDDVTLARHLIETCGVAAIPPSVFYLADRDEGRRLLRFAFCKRLETLERAAERLRRGLG